MNNTLKAKFDLKLLGRKEIFIILGLTLLVIVNYCAKLGNIAMMDIYFYTDLVLPVYFGAIAYFIYKKDCVSEINNLSIIYGGKKYNKILLLRLLRFLCLAVVLYIGFVYITSSGAFVQEPDIRMIDIVNKHTPMNIFLKAVPNLLFFIMLPLFLLKITKNEFLIGGVVSVLLIEEMAGDGSYTYPLSLVVNYGQRNVYTLSQFLMNRAFITGVGLMMLWYVVSKINKK